MFLEDFSSLCPGWHFLHVTGQFAFINSTDCLRTLYFNASGSQKSYQSVQTLGYWSLHSVVHKEDIISIITDATQSSEVNKQAIYTKPTRFSTNQES